MPYLIQTRPGKERYVEALLRKYEIPAKPSSMKGFLVCFVRPPASLMGFSHVLKIVEISQQQADKFLKGASKAATRLEKGSLIEVVSGTYMGFRGIVEEINNGRVRAGLSVFGKIFPVDLQVDEVKVVDIPEIWK